MSASKWKPYPNYKNTHSKWIGEIPSHWTINKVKYLAEFVNGFAFDSNSFVDEGVPIIRIGDIAKSVNWEKTKKVPHEIADSTREYQLQLNDIVVALTGATVGKSAIYQSTKQALVNQRVAIIRTNDNIQQQLLLYSIQSDYVMEQVKLLSYGGAQGNISHNDIAEIFIPLPPIEDQILVSKFIHNKIKIIDQNIRDLEKTVLLLEEKRSAIITKAVTKGLKSDIPMKDSGVDWIGDIPEHWFCAKNLRLVDVKGRVGWHGLTTADYVDDGNYLLGASSISESGDFSLRRIKYVPDEIYERDKTIQVIDGDILVVKVGATIGRSTVVRNLDRNATINAALFLVRPNQELYPEYFQYQLMSSHYRYQMDIQTAESAQGNLFKRDFVQMKTIVPPYAEQQEIAERIEKELSIIEDLITRITIQIDKLKQYHDAVISAAVIGKIDVRSL
ncbi:restriction endonuclease subunit S [Candidatus Poseidoniaceae archaeon]|nr:restriction endonuclease subunit S [Candidatus Poseidoniaceae archaeon]